MSKYIRERKPPSQGWRTFLKNHAEEILLDLPGRLCRHDDEIVGKERAVELRKLSSDTARKTFTGRKQSDEHISKRINKQKETKSKWSEEKRNEISLMNKINGAKSSKLYNFLVDENFKHYGTWTSLSIALKKELGIIVGEGSLSNFYRGKYKTLKCGIVDIKILS